jgi:hypothetical protein
MFHRVKSALNFAFEDNFIQLYENTHSLCFDLEYIALDFTIKRSIALKSELYFANQANLFEPHPSQTCPVHGKNGRCNF